jgi:hypothetical protein
MIDATHHRPPTILRPVAPRHVQRRSAAPGPASLGSRAFHFCPCKTSPGPYDNRRSRAQNHAGQPEPAIVAVRPRNSSISQIHMRKTRQAAFIIIRERSQLKANKPVFGGHLPVASNWLSTGKGWAARGASPRGTTDRLHGWGGG